MKGDVEGIAEGQARSVASHIIRVAKRGGTEADLRRETAPILEEATAVASLRIIPRDEYSVACGRADSVYNRLVLEYKRPGLLRPTNRGRANQDAINQVKGYIIDVAKRERREAHRLAGVVTDGFYYIFVRRVGDGWVEDDPLPVNRGSTERFLRLLFSLSIGTALIPENLVEDFGPKNIRAQRAVRALHRAFGSCTEPLVGKLFEQWKQFFSEATDYREWSERIKSKPEFLIFVKSLWTKEEIEALHPASVFFVLHTYYAILIKLVASLAASRFAGGTAAPLSGMAGMEGEDLKKAFYDLERGGLFPEYGIRNFLEGDFFRWYVTAWDKDIEAATGKLVQKLAEYDPGTLELAPENARDLLKKLYHYLLPREIRHDLGEYYTPDWLAERLIRQTLGTRDLGDPYKRVLDPACGSGTFLVLLINHVKRVASERKIGPTETLDLIRKNIVGFDLNPLAVIAARTNYIIALGDLLKEAKRLSPDGIDIPVYQCDSILTPSQGTEIFTSGLFPLKTTVGVFEVPEAFATKERMEALANELDDCVESGVGEEAFLKRLEQSVDIYSTELEKVKPALLKLYSELRELHKQGLNGVWARIIKNYFAPLFQGTFDYVVGNPPWVNWEHLPDEYRRSSMRLWKEYGLFPKREKGMQTILGAAKYDISMLMTYVAIDRYLQMNGKLGFVLSQSLFKTSGAGQGFRRFLLPDNVPFRPVAVEDMVELKPFEGAANRTSVAVFLKGKKTRYPVPYQYWKKKSKGRGSAIGFDTPYENVTKEEITFQAWHAQPVDRSDRASAWITARRRALGSLHKVLGKSFYTGRAGTYTCGANAVFWLEILGERPGDLLIVSNYIEGAKKKVPRVQTVVEKDLIFPLLRGADVSRWHASPSINILLTHEEGKRLKAIPETEMQSDYPETYCYLVRLKDFLAKRAAYKRYFRSDAPFYSIFNIGDYTFARWKVVWRYIATGMVCSVVGPTREEDPVIPDCKLMLCAAKSSNEAYYLAAVLNSAPASLIVKAYTVSTQISTHVLDYVGVPEFAMGNTVHRELAQLSRSAHEAADRDDCIRLRQLEHAIDQCAAQIWGLSEAELTEIKQSLEEM
jgi:SAM-dependent methyltransferase